MTLDVLENRYRIKLADDDFFNLFLKNSEKLGKHQVVFQFFDGIIQIFYENAIIYTITNSNLWISHLQKNNRSLYAFGVGEPKANATNIPVCVIDFPTEGIDNSCIGAYADEEGSVFVLIRVNYQKLRKIPINSILTSPERIQASEKGKKRYFITLGPINQPEILENVIKFVQEMGKITDHNPEIYVDLEDEKIVDSDITSEDDDMKSCVLCGKPLSNSELDLEDEVNSFKHKDADKCYDCIGKIYAARGISEIKKHVSIKLFNEKTLLRVFDDPDVFRNYFKILKKLSLIKDFSKDVYIFNQAQNIDDYIKTYSEYLEVPIENSNEISLKVSDGMPNVASKDTEGQKVCEVCGAKLDLDNFYKSKDSSDGLTGKCKECSRKSHAAKAIEEIRNYVEPATPFNKEDLLKESNNRMVFLDYFWTLQEFDLLDEDKKPDFYILKNEEKLNEFIAKYGEESHDILEGPVTNKPTEKKTTPKLAKACQICHETLPISNFYKSPSSEDGYSNKCKECSRKSYAARALLALMECVEPGVSFYKKDLLDQCENQLQFRDYFWTLQELDLLEYNEKTDLYSLTQEDVINQFLNKYGEKPVQEDISKDTNDIQDEKPFEEIKSKDSSDIKVEKPIEKETDKDVKVCVTCGKSLPASNFYKSSYNPDGLVDNCKVCAETKNAAKILMEIQEYVKIGEPFTKNELSNKIGNETRANYYIWTLQEQDLISYTERTDTYVLETNDKFKIYQDMIKNESSDEIEEVSQSEKVKNKPTCKIETEEKIVNTDLEVSPDSQDFSRKEIIYISDNNDSLHSNIIIKGIIKNDSLIKTLNGLETLINSHTNKMFVNQHIENYLEVMIDLNVKNESMNEALNLLQEEKWIDKTNNRD